jgi:trk system potassium uptake protein TrkH
MHHRPSASAKYSVNFAMVVRIMGWLLMIEGGFMLFPLITCLIYHESDYLSFLITNILTCCVGAVMTSIHPRHKNMGKREGFLLTALVWVVFSCFGMIPFMLCSTPLNLSDAFFESMSGFTTTGASVLTSIEHFSHGIHLWRCLMQWIGGMGIILFTLAVIPMLNHSGGMQMFNAEVTGITHDKLRPRISSTAKGLWGVYIVLTIMLWILLWLGPMNLFDSICHSLSSISTGGFSTSDQSIGAWDSTYVKVVITIFMFLGGVNFSLLFRASTGNVKALWSNDTFKAYIRIIVVMLILFSSAIILQGKATSIASITIDPLFQIVSTITSTGYTVTDFESWGTFVLALVFVLMFCGACAGSTSGGAKIDRMLYLIKNLDNELKRCVHSNSIYSVRINNKVIPTELVNKVIAFLCLYVALIMIGGILLTAVGLPLVDAFFSSFSCISNTGLGAGITGYGGSYELIPNAGKWLLSLLMLIGRLELFTVLILFTRSFWKK